MHKVVRGLVVGLLLVGTVACGSDDGDDATNSEGDLEKTECIDTWVEVLNEVADDDLVPPTAQRAQQQLEDALGDDTEDCLELIADLDDAESEAAVERLNQRAKVLVLQAAS